MQVSVEKKEGINCSLLIEVPAAEVDKAVANKIAKTAKTIKMDGFRPGKVPVSLVKKKFGEQIRFEVIYDIIPQKYTKAIQDEKLAVAGIDVDLKENEEGKPLKFEVNVELFPEFEVNGFDQIKVAKPVVELGDAEVNKMIENLRKQLATYNEVYKPAATGDKVTIDFTGWMDGVQFEGGSATDSPIVIGSNQMIPGFEDGLLGLYKDWTNSLNLTFPEDYQNKELAGKNVQFDVVVKKVEEAILPEIDEEFISKFGVKGDVNTFASEIKDNMQRELKFIIQKKIKEQVFEGLRNIANFDVPKALVKREIDAAKQNLVKSMGGEKSGFDVNQLPDNLFEKNAEQKVKTSLILDNLLKAHTFEVTEEDVDALLSEMIQAYENPEETKAEVKKNAQEMNNLKSLVIENKLTDWVLNQAQVEDKIEDFFEIIRENMQASQMGQF